MCLVCCQPEGAVSGAPCVKFAVNLKVQYAVHHVFSCCQPEGAVCGAPCVRFAVNLKVQYAVHQVFSLLST